VIRISIIAASPLARAGLQNLVVGKDIAVVESVASVSLLGDDQTLDSESDVLLVDASGEGLESSLTSVANLAAESPVILLTDRAAGTSIPAALRAGIRALLPNDVTSTQLTAAIRAAAAGLFVFHPRDAGAASAGATPASARLAELHEALTPREHEVLQMLASGLGNKQIADRLNISEHTVKFHVASILGKLNAGSRTEAVAIGIRRGLVLL
jgi:NarL family two-component system response regulator YdfI